MNIPSKIKFIIKIIDNINNNDIITFKQFELFENNEMDVELIEEYNNSNDNNKFFDLFMSKINYNFNKADYFILDLKDIKNVFGSLVSKKYEISQRAIEDTKMAGGYFFDENMNAKFVKGYTTDDDDDELEEDESESSETESVEESKKEQKRLAEERQKREEKKTEAEKETAKDDTQKTSSEEKKK